jgi:TetR/AcrR family transcriptional regulator, mexJK operon transcriptional repressor
MQQKMTLRSDKTEMILKEQKKTKDEKAGTASAHMRLEEDRVAELLDIAAEVFIEHGFEAASTNEIARRANSSKTTFYSRFPTKEKLFIAVLERRMDHIFKQVATALPPDAPIEGTLREYGSRVLELAISNDQVAMLKVVSMESRRFPELARQFYELGPKRGIAYLTQYMQEQIRRGCLIDDDPTIMAEHFHSLLTSGAVRWCVLGVRIKLEARDRQKRIDAAVKAFLRAYSPIEPLK